jgi:hypothetical protein
MAGTYSTPRKLTGTRGCGAAHLSPGWIPLSGYIQTAIRLVRSDPIVDDGETKAQLTAIRSGMTNSAFWGTDESNRKVVISLPTHFQRVFKMRKSAKYGMSYLENRKCLTYLLPG